MYRSIKTHEALAIILSHNAVVKNIATQSPEKEPVFDNNKNSWGFVLRQLKDPENFRPARSVDRWSDRSLLWNPQTGSYQKFKIRQADDPQKTATESQWESGLINEKKGMPKPGATYTKKTSVTLLPPDGKLILFNQDHGVVMIFDVRKCKVKSNYIWDRNVQSNGKAWYSGSSTYRHDPVSMEDIRRKQNKAIEDGILLNWNELLVDLCADALIGIAAPKNDRSRRLNAQYRRLVTLEEMGVDLPLFIITPENGVATYTLEQQNNDRIGRLCDVDASFVSKISLLESRLFSAVKNGTSDDEFNRLHRQFFMSISQNDAKAVREFLKQYPFAVTFNQKEFYDYPIEIAMSNHDDQCVTAIAEAVSADSMDRYGYGKALLKAIGRQRYEAARSLLICGADINYRSNKEWTTVDQLVFCEEEFIDEILTVIFKHELFIQATDLFIKLAENKKWSLVFKFINVLFSKGVAFKIAHEALNKIASAQKDSDALHNLVSAQGCYWAHEEQANKLLSDCNNGRESLEFTRESEFGQMMRAYADIKTIIKIEEKAEEKLAACYSTELSKLHQYQANRFMQCESVARKRVTSDSQMMRTFNTIVLLEHKNLLKKQVVILEEELARTVTFGGVKTRVPVIGLEKKKAKLNVLKAAILVIGNQLSLGGVASQDNVDGFAQKLEQEKSSLWNNGRTMPLIAKSKSILALACEAKEQEEFDQPEHRA